MEENWWSAFAYGEDGKILRNVLEELHKDFWWIVKTVKALWKGINLHCDRSIAFHRRWFSIMPGLKSTREQNQLSGM